MAGLSISSPLLVSAGIVFWVGYNYDKILEWGQEESYRLELFALVATTEAREYLVALGDNPEVKTQINKLLETDNDFRAIHEELIEQYPEIAAAFDS